MNLKALRSELDLYHQDKRELDSIFGIIFEYVTGRDYRTSQILGYEIKNDEEIRIKAMFNRALRGEPVQYIVGKWDFMGRHFIVTPDVLIPRSDTEILCERAIEYINKNGNELNVLDLCTGSGCIGISIACSAKKSNVTCSDVSNKALDVARQNARINGVDIDFILSDMLENCEKYDVIVSNPPYIPSKTVETLDATVKDYEPRIALDGGDDGLDFYRIIAKDAKKHINCGGTIFLEIGYDQKISVSEIFQNEGYDNIECLRDYGGNDRVIICSYGR